ncbi:MAG: diguanylate cyclase [Miltoncostaeaceae bacterium]
MVEFAPHDLAAGADQTCVLPPKTLERILASANVGIVSADAEGRVIFANTEASRLTARSTEEMVGRDLASALGAEALPRMWEWTPSNEDGIASTVSLRRADGSSYPARFWTSGASEDPAAATTVSFADISAERERADKLRMSEARFRRLAEHAPIGIFSWQRGEDGYFNTEATAILGETATSPGGDWADRVHPDDRDRARQGHASALQGGTSYRDIVRFQAEGGHTRLVEIHATPLLNAHGAATGMVGTLLDVTDSQRYQLQTEALRRVATAAADDKTATEEIFALVAEEVARLLDSDGAAVARVFDEGAELVGQWVRRDELGVGPGETIPTTGPGATARAIRDGMPARSENGTRVSIAAPIWVHGALWGVVGAVTLDKPGLAEDAEHRLGAFAQLLEATIASAESREQLEFRADRDHLTGLWNHRQFHERLRSEIARAQRSRSPLSLVLIDLDRFKQVNDVHGHQAGDDVLVEAATRLSDRARESDVVARVGGEELAWLLPDTDGDGAMRAAESLRAAFHEKEFPAVGTQTASFGASDLSEASAADELYHQADVALYYAKQTGRDRCVRYSFEVAEDLIQAKAEARGIESPMLAGLRALGWSMDGRSPELDGHSERVADLAVVLAAALSWSIEGAAQLREAALASGVAQQGLSREIVDGRPIEPSERGDLRRHSERSARAAAELLEEAQVEWVLHHLERYDGLGYPDGLAEDRVPEGAYLIGLAQCWDRLTVVGTGDSLQTLSADDALRTMEAERGKRFSPRAVEALLRLHEAGALAASASVTTSASSSR